MQYSDEFNMSNAEAHNGITMKLKDFLLQLQRDYFAGRGEKENATEMSKRIGITQPTWQRLISGSTKGPDWDTASKIAAFFNLTMDELRLCERKSDPGGGNGGGGGSIKACDPASATYDAGLASLLDDLPEERRAVVRNLVLMTQGMTQNQLTELMRRCEDLQSQNYEIVTELARSNPEFLDEILKKRRA